MANSGSWEKKEAFICRKHYTDDINIVRLDKLYK